MSGLGHNGGPTLEPGGSWRRFAWKKARADLMPNTMPLEVVRRRVRRARELGIDYKAYASIRAASGQDVVALLFSSNALRLLKTEALPRDRANALAAVKGAGRLSLVHPPLDPARAVQLNPEIDAASRAPGLSLSWSATGAAVKDLLAEGRLPADRVVLVAETALEREWLTAGGLAGLIPADRYFAAASAQ